MKHLYNGISNTKDEKNMSLDLILIILFIYFGFYMVGSQDDLPPVLNNGRHSNTLCCGCVCQISSFYIVLFLA